MSSTKTQLEAVLGRSIENADRHSIPTLNELPKDLADEARWLASRARASAVAFLQFYVVRADLDAVAGFVDGVLLGDAALETWGRRDVLVFPALNLTTHLTLSADAVLRTLASVDGERWWRVKPTAEWDWSGLAGAPGVLRRDAPYWWQPPDEVDFADLDPDVDELEHIASAAIAWRRWLANRIAYELRNDETAQLATSVDEVTALLGLPTEACSESARIAIRALLRTGWTVDSSGQPGFRGLDANFAE